MDKIDYSKLGEEVARGMSPMFLKLGKDINKIEVKPEINVDAPKIPEIKIPKIDPPEVKIPEIVIPEIKIPDINVPQPIVNIDVDKVRITNLDEIPAPSELNIDGIVNPIVKAIKDFSGGGGAGAGAMEFYEETSGKYLSPSATNPLPVSATLNVGDIEIGAVELKDGESDTRVAIGTDGTQNALWTQNKSLDSVIYADGGFDDITTGIAIMGRRQDLNEPQPIAVDYRGYLYTLNNSEYNENQEDISATGMAIMWRDDSSEFQPVATEHPMPIDITADNVGLATSANQSSLLVEMQVTNGAYALLYDDVGGGIAYQGWAVPGTATSAGSWRIRKIDTSADPDVTITFADGNNNFDNVWNDRTSLSYS